MRTVYWKWFKETTGNIQKEVSNFDGGLASREGLAGPDGLLLLGRHRQPSFRDSTSITVPLIVNVFVS